MPSVIDSDSAIMFLKRFPNIRRYLKILASRNPGQAKMALDAFMGDQSFASSREAALESYFEAQDMAEDPSDETLNKIVSKSGEELTERERMYLRKRELAKMKEK